MPLDAISLTRLNLVNPKLSAIVTRMAEFMDQSGISFRITQGMRTWTEQDALYAQGRTVPGQIVTNAKGGESWHNFGCAVDFVPMLNSLPMWDRAHGGWDAIIKCGKAMNLVSGSEFTKPDYPHFQMTGRFPLAKPDEEARQIYDQQGAKAFWGEVNASYP